MDKRRPAPSECRKFVLQWKEHGREELFSEFFEEIEETVGQHILRFKKRKVARVQHTLELWQSQRIPYDKTNQGLVFVFWSRSATEKKGPVGSVSAQTKWDCPRTDDKIADFLFFYSPTGNLFFRIYVLEERPPPGIFSHFTSTLYSRRTLETV